MLVVYLPVLAGQASTDINKYPYILQAFFLPLIAFTCQTHFAAVEISHNSYTEAKLRGPSNINT
jgi:hypothetical protein